MRPENQELVKALLDPLGGGETQAITYAQKHNCLLALDDQKARDAATKMGITITGSLGILRYAYETCHIETKTTLKSLLKKLEKDLYIEEWLHNWVLEAEKPDTINT